MKFKIKRLLRRCSLLLFDLAILYGCALITIYAVTESLSLLHDNLYLYFGFLLLHMIFLIGVRFYVIRIVDSSLELALRGVGGLVSSALVILVLMVFLSRDIVLPLRLLIPYTSLTIVLILGYRVGYRMLLSYHVRASSTNGFPKTVVYGAGEIGLQLARQYFKNKFPFSITAFIDDDPMKLHTMVGGITVQGSIDDLDTVLKNNFAEVLIIGITDLTSERMKKALDAADRHGVEVKIVPSLIEMEEGRKNVADIRAINYEDLLGRSTVSFDRTPIRNMVKGKRVLVTGAGGSIGSEISRQLLSYDPSRLILLDVDETELHDLSLRLHGFSAEFSQDIMPVVCDVRDAEKIDRIFTEYQPEIVFHAAAYKHVPMMEYYPEEAVRTNICGTFNVFNSAVTHKCSRCILISTDKAVNPTNVMGATKRVAEMIATMLNTKETEIICVRFGNVLGSRGSMLPLFMEQIRAGLPITVTDRKIIRYFMTIPEAVSLVFLAGALGNGGEVMVLDMGEQVNIYDFAKRLVKYFGDGRSEVVITGLRPGEKLYEEKLSDKDKTIPTDNPKVYKAIVNGTLHISEFITLMQSIHDMQSTQLITTLCQLVPEFTYQGPLCEGIRE